MRASSTHRNILGLALSYKYDAGCMVAGGRTERGAGEEVWGGGGGGGGLATAFLLSHCTSFTWRDIPCP